MVAVGGASSVLTVCLFIVLLPAVKGSHSEDALCTYADQVRQQQWAEPQEEQANELRGLVQDNGTIHCRHGFRCFGLWEKSPDGEMHLVQQGCWRPNDVQECLGDRCLVTAARSQVHNTNYRFCCCSSDFCNANYTEAPPTANTPALRRLKTRRREERRTDSRPLQREETVLIALVMVAAAAIIIMLLFLGYRILKGKHKHSVSRLDVMEENLDPTVDLNNLKLLELIGRGRYGSVFRGSVHDCCVAVKLFSSANRQNFINERSIYFLPLLQHDNIVRFLAADERTTPDGRPEFLIVMEFYPHGCLSRFLSLHTVDWLSCCRMCHGVTRGLAFLHTELYRGDQYKPAVAHRDVTSRNVLVRADLSCVLTDFGLSMKLTENCPSRPGDEDTVAISEVGTVRYMAPEVLGGALNLRDCESALKQVDVYALGLLYWETFKRCSELFPGEVMPEFQLAFQEELGSHPSFEDMQIHVARDKHRPKFPKVWKENNPVLRSLKETIEDCWDQDAEARLTAQCAEERLCELTLLSVHTATHNHRNLSSGLWPHMVDSSSSTSCAADLQVDVVKNLQGDSQLASFAKTTTGRAKVAEKIKKSINYDWQQARSSSSGTSVSCAVSPAFVLGTVSDPGQAGGTVPSIPVCLQLTEEDLEAPKFNTKEVNQSLRESSDENLLEHSQKDFTTTDRTNTLLYHQILQTAEVKELVSNLHGGLGDTQSSSSIQPFPKQQNQSHRPTSLHLNPRTKETPLSSSRLQLGKHRWNHRQVEMGVAKMNTVTVAAAAEPHLVTTMTNTRATGTNGTRLHPATLVTAGYSVGIPTLVMNENTGGGHTNPVGPQMDHEDKMEVGLSGRDGSCMNLLNSSPDENEPLLRQEQPPAEREPQQRHSRTASILSGRGSNSNNNNNRHAPGPEDKVQGSEIKSRKMIGPEFSQDRGIRIPDPQSNPASEQIIHMESPAASLVSDVANKVLPSGQAGQVLSSAKVQSQDSATSLQLQTVLVSGPVLFPDSNINPPAHQVHCVAATVVPSRSDTSCDSSLPSEKSLEASEAPETATSPEVPFTKIPFLFSRVLDFDTRTFKMKALVTDAPTSDPDTPAVEDPPSDLRVNEATSNAPGLQHLTSDLAASVQEIPNSHRQTPALDPDTSAVLVPIPYSALESPRLDEDASLIKTLHSHTEVTGLKAALFSPDGLSLETSAVGFLKSESLAAPASGAKGLLQNQANARRPERPCSLDLSATCPSSDVCLTDGGNLSASGEKIKRRVKTPYTVKKWRPSSWVVSTDTTLDPDLELSLSGHTESSSGLHQPGGFGMIRMNQSKSSMAVFLVGGRGTATTTSSPDGMTSF
ncbi:bone morphogenetic protein receptor type-2-like isoform X2 [Thalassophryne amazonica]|uniref:bone morphogenetic protein receptor type-2-like isoform X2 n=1 Tax=Thalassophryne amazonica TaxID=390379 RepID=UPI0014718151|nr:bone morphogenetic protein receptor type-2-like isoform X2 [Thalassophryne amazonica]